MLEGCSSCSPSAAGIEELIGLSRGTVAGQRRGQRRRGRQEAELLHAWRFGGMPRSARHEIGNPVEIGVGDAPWSSTEAGRGRDATSRQPYGPSSFDVWYLQADRQHGRAEHFDDLGWDRPSEDESEAWSRLAGPTQPPSYHGVTGAWDRAVGLRARQQEGLRDQPDIPLGPIWRNWGLDAEEVRRSWGGWSAEQGDFPGVHEHRHWLVDFDEMVEDWERPPHGDPLVPCPTQLELPPWSAAGAGAIGPQPPSSDQTYPIRDCLLSVDGTLTSWPVTRCRAPCGDPITPLPTTMPQLSPWSGATVRPVTEGEWTRLSATNPQWAEPNAAPMRRPDPVPIAFFSSAVALLEQHVDLVQWAICLAASYHPRLSPADREAIVTYVVDTVRDGCNVYLFDHVLGGHGYGTTGDLDSPPNCAFERTNPHCLVQAGHCDHFDLPEGPGALASTRPTTYDLDPTLGSFHLAYHQIANEEHLRRAWDGVMAAACAILHEVVHLAGELPIVDACRPGFAVDKPPRDGETLLEFDDRIDPLDFQCWKLQNMTTTIFRYGLSRRYPDLHVVEPGPIGPDTDPWAWQFAWSA